MKINKSKINKKVGSNLTVVTCSKPKFYPYYHDSKQSRLCHLRNGIPHGSVLVPLLFNIYMYNLPSKILKNFAYTDNLALLNSSGNWKDLQGALSQDMITLSVYFLDLEVEAQSH